MEITNFQTLGDKIDYVECVCCHPEHVLRFLSQETAQGPVLSAYVFMERGGFWRRLWTAVKYVFGVDNEFGHFGEWELHPQDADRLVGILDRIRHKPSGPESAQVVPSVCRSCGQETTVNPLAQCVCTNIDCTEYVLVRNDYIPRRNDINRYVPAEKAIMAAMGEVESMGADELLTDAVVLLSQAKDRVADFVDRKLTRAKD